MVLLPTIHRSSVPIKDHMSKELKSDRHTVLLLSDHMVFGSKYRGEILIGDEAMVADEIICKTCKEMELRHRSNIMQKRYVQALDLSPGFVTANDRNLILSKGDK